MTDSRRVIVTGATGLIGSRLCQRLNTAGYAVVVFSRNPERARKAVPGCSDYIAWRAQEDGAWAAQIDGAHAVVNLAGAPISTGPFGRRWDEETRAAIRNSRVIGTRGLVNALAAAKDKPQVFVSGSAIGYYGYHDEDDPITETGAQGTDFVAQVVGAWEAEAVKAEALGIRTVRVRTGMVLDAHEGVLPQIMLPFRFFAGGPVLPGSQWYSWIHLDDEVGLLMLALEDERVRGPLNATAPEPERNRDFSAAVGRVMGSPSWLPVPDFSLRLLMGEMADLVIRGQRVVPQKALELGYEFGYPSLGPALRDLLS